MRAHPGKLHVRIIRDPHCEGRRFAGPTTDAPHSRVNFQVNGDRPVSGSRDDGPGKRGDILLVGDKRLESELYNLRRLVEHGKTVKENPASDTGIAQASSFLDGRNRNRRRPFLECDASDLRGAVTVTVGLDRDTEAGCTPGYTQSMLGKHTKIVTEIFKMDDRPCCTHVSRYTTIWKRTT